MKMIRTICCILTLSLLTSCTTYKLDEKDIKLNPYKVNDILVFRNHLNEDDTVVITRVERNVHTTDNLAFFAGRNETLTVMAKFSDPFSMDKGRTIEGEFLEIIHTKDSVYVSLDLSLRYAHFYDPLFSVDALRKQSPQNLKVGDKEYPNVIQVFARDKEYQDRGDVINSLYWSNEYGYVKAVMSRGKYWYLVERIRK